MKGGLGGWGTSRVAMTSEFTGEWVPRSISFTFTPRKYIERGEGGEGSDLVISTRERERQRVKNNKKRTTTFVWKWGGGGVRGDDTL